jgi:hypothetical protein
MILQHRDTTREHPRRTEIDDREDDISRNIYPSLLYPTSITHTYLPRHHPLHDSSQTSPTDTPSSLL